MAGGIENLGVKNRQVVENGAKANAVRGTAPRLLKTSVLLI